MIGMLFSVFIDLFLLAFQIIMDQVDLGKFIEEFFITEFHPGHIDQDRSFDLASTGLAHPAPILVSHIYDLVGRNDLGGHIEILHLDAMQADIQHISISSV